MTEDTTISSASNDSQGYIQLAADIVSAYVSNNSLPSSDLPKLLSETYSAITGLAGVTASASATVEAERKSPAVPIKKSLTHDYIVCLEDGKQFRSLKRHLRSTYDMSPEQYRAKWGLPPDYPMVAPAYAQARSELAKSMGLGRKRVVEAPEASNDTAPATKGRGGRRKAA